MWFHEPWSTLVEVRLQDLVDMLGLAVRLRWNAVDILSSMPKYSINSFQKPEMNTEPRSDTMSEGNPCNLSRMWQKGCSQSIMLSVRTWRSEGYTLGSGRCSDNSTPTSTGKNTDTRCA